MAEDGHIWLQKHAHESSILTYGTLGTAEYRDPYQDWTFLRDENNPCAQEHDEENTDYGAKFQLRLLPESADLVQTHFAHRKERLEDGGSSKKVNLDDATILSAVQQPPDHKPYGDEQALIGESVTLGCAVSSGSYFVDSRSSDVPVVAYITGSGRDKLEFICAGRKELVYDSEHEDTISVQVPSFSQGQSTSWTFPEPIQQVVFSRRGFIRHSNGFLAVRQISKTDILEPLFRWPAQGSPSDTLSLNPNLVLSLDIAVTGNHVHSDVAFDPDDHEQFGIVDVEGNWSIWKIHGRRTYTARRVCQAQLRGSGKIFSWGNRKRPKDVGTYFDGWHRILWVSSNRQSYDRILVCNRQSAKVFDVSGDEVCNLGVQLNARKANSYILDICLGPLSHLCLILTTSRVLLYDIAAENKEGRGLQVARPSLCSWQHFHNPTDWSLKMSLIEHGEDFLICLYTSLSTVLKVFPSRLTKGKNGIKISSSSSYPIRLPPEYLASPIAYVGLVTVQVAKPAPLSGQIPYITQIMIHCEDLSMTTMNARWPQPYRGQAGDFGQSRNLNLPPSRNLQTRSERYVDWFEDEYDLTGFVTDEEKFGCSSVRCSHHETSVHHGNGMESTLTRKNLSMITSTIRPTLLSSSDETFSDVISFFERLRRIVQRSMTATSTFKPSLMVDLVGKNWEAEDIESDSIIFQQASLDMGQDIAEKFRLISYDHVESLSELYERLFSNYVQSLASSVEDRTRVQRERFVRRAAVDLHLANQIIRPVSTIPTLQQKQATLRDELQVMSDPLFEETASSSRFVLPTISASQPQAATKNDGHTYHRSTPTSTPILSPLPDMLSRLAAYATISNPPSEEQITNEFTSKHLSSLLSYLPSDTNARPDDHDWRSIELALSITKADVSHAQIDQVRRRVEKLTKAQLQTQKRAELFKELANSNSSGTSNRQYEVLPIRGPVPSPNFYQRESVTQADRTTTLSDQEPTQIDDPNRISPVSKDIISTQLERGVFATRRESSKQTSAKKRRRKAGF